MLALWHGLPQVTDLDSPDSFLIQICIFLGFGPVFIRPEIQWKYFCLLILEGPKIENTYMCIQAAVCTHSRLGSSASLHTNCQFRVYMLQVTCGQKYLFGIDHFISTSGRC